MSECQKQRIWSAIISPQIQKTEAIQQSDWPKVIKYLGIWHAYNMHIRKKINFGFLFLRMGCWCIRRKNFEHPLDTQPLQHLSSQEVSWSHFFMVSWSHFDQNKRSRLQYLLFPPPLSGLSSHQHIFSFTKWCLFSPEQTKHPLTVSSTLSHLNLWELQCNYCM